MSKDLDPKDRLGISLNREQVLQVAALMRFLRKYPETARVLDRTEGLKGAERVFYRAAERAEKPKGRFGYGKP